MFNVCPPTLKRHMDYNDKQVQIMEIAETLFAEKGFNGTSVRDIAEKAQCKPCNDLLLFRLKG